jgi:hypothetical protein
MLALASANEPKLTLGKQMIIYDADNPGLQQSLGPARRILVALCLYCGLATPPSLLAGEPAVQRELVKLPAPVRDYAAQFAPHCSALGKGDVIANEMHSDELFGPPDINLDGLPDFFEYKCMFGCERFPFAFVGAGVPCAFGVLLLSSQDGYRAISLPGTVTRFEVGPPASIVVTRQRIKKSDCPERFSCQYLFELREGRFQIVAPCPADGCRLPVPATLGMSTK